MNFSQFGNDLYTGARSFPIVAKRRLWFTIALTLMALSFAVLGVRGLNPGIEFRGGSEFTLSNVANTSGDPARAVLAEEGVAEAPRITTVAGTDSADTFGNEISTRVPSTNFSACFCVTRP